MGMPAALKAAVSARSGTSTPRTTGTGPGGRPNVRQNTAASSSRPAGPPKGRRAEEPPLGVAPAAPLGGREVTRAEPAASAGQVPCMPGGGMRGAAATAVSSADLLRPRGGVPVRLRDKRARHADVEEHRRRRRRAPPHAVCPEARGVSAAVADDPGGERPAGARGEGVRRLGTAAAQNCASAGTAAGHVTRAEGPGPSGGEAAGEGRGQHLWGSSQRSRHGAPRRVYAQRGVRPQ